MKYYPDITPQASKFKELRESYDTILVEKVAEQAKAILNIRLQRNLKTKGGSTYEPALVDLCGDCETTIEWKFPLPKISSYIIRNRMYDRTEINAIVQHLHEHFNEMGYDWQITNFSIFKLYVRN